MDISEHLDILIEVINDSYRLKTKTYILMKMDRGSYDSVNSVMYDIFYHYMERGYCEKFDPAKGDLRYYVLMVANGILSNLIGKVENKKQGKSKSTDIYAKHQRQKYNDQMYYLNDEAATDLVEIFIDFAERRGQGREAELYLDRGKKYSEAATELGVSEVALRKRVSRLVRDFRQSGVQGRGRED